MIFNPSTWGVHIFIPSTWEVDRGSDKSEQRQDLGPIRIRNGDRQETTGGCPRISDLSGFYLDIWLLIFLIRLIRLMLHISVLNGFRDEKKAH